MRGNRNSTNVRKFTVEARYDGRENQYLYTSKHIGKSYKCCFCMSVLSALKLEKWRLKHIYFTTRRIFKHQCYKLKIILNLPYFVPGITDYVPEITGSKTTNLRISTKL